MPDEMKPIASARKAGGGTSKSTWSAPEAGLGDPKEVLPQAPSRWYLTGFLVPIDAASLLQKLDEEAQPKSWTRPNRARRRRGCTAGASRGSAALLPFFHRRERACARRHRSVRCHASVGRLPAA